MSAPDFSNWSQADFRRGLRSLAKELRAEQDELNRQFAWRLIVWQAARDAGLSVAEIARASGLKPVTVRQLLRRAQ